MLPGLAMRRRRKRLPFSCSQVMPDARRHSAGALSPASKPPLESSSRGSKGAANASAGRSARASTNRDFMRILQVAEHRDRDLVRDRDRVRPESNKITITSGQCRTTASVRRRAGGILIPRTGWTAADTWVGASAGCLWPAGWAGHVTGGESGERLGGAGSRDTTDEGDCGGWVVGCRRWVGTSARALCSRAVRDRRRGTGAVAGAPIGAPRQGGTVARDTNPERHEVPRG